MEIRPKEMMRKFLVRAAVNLYVCLITAVFILEEFADAKKAGRKMRNKSGKDNPNVRGFLILISVVFALILAPSIIGFIYSVAKDPATPSIMKQLLELGQSKFTRRLSDQAAKAE